MAEDYDTEDLGNPEAYARKMAERERRRLERLWAKSATLRVKAGAEIGLRWVLPPVDGEAADAQITVGDEEMEYTVEPIYRTMDGEHKRRTKDYAKQVEKWALWKWHTMRGTPVSDRDVYLTEPGFAEPAFVWLDAVPVPKRASKQEQAAA